MPNDSRLLPQTFRGGQLSIREIEGLNLDAGRLSQVNQRDSGDYGDMAIITAVGVKNIRTRHASSDAFDFASLTYAWKTASAPATAMARWTIFTASTT